MSDENNFVPIKKRDVCGFCGMSRKEYEKLEKIKDILNGDTIILGARMNSPFKKLFGILKVIKDVIEE